MKYLLTTILFFVFTIQCFSQEGRIIISGLITHFETPIQDIHIINLNSNNGTISGINGQFEIEVKTDDLLFISHLEYKSKKVIVKQIDIEKGQLKIYLESFTNYLETVELKNHNLSGNLLQDLKSISKDTLPKLNVTSFDFMKLALMPSKSDYLVNYEKPTLNNVDPIVGGLGGGFGIPFGDKENALRKALRIKKSIPEKIIKDFGTSYFIKELKIPEDKIYLFISYCENSNLFELYQKNKILDIRTLFNKESSIFLKLNE